MSGVGSCRPHLLNVFVSDLILIKTFAGKEVSLSDKAKTHGGRKFTEVNDRLSRARPASGASVLGAFLTQHESERTFLRRFLRSLTKSLISLSRTLDIFLGLY